MGNVTFRLSRPPLDSGGDEIVPWLACPRREFVEFRNPCPIFLVRLLLNPSADCAHFVIVIGPWKPVPNEPKDRIVSLRRDPDDHHA